MTLFVALAAVVCVPRDTGSSPTPTPLAVSPTPTSTPTPTDEPTPSPTESPSPTAPPTPAPITKAQLIVSYWGQVRLRFSWIPEVTLEAVQGGGPAYYLGVKDGRAVFGYEDATVQIGRDGGAVWHEAGHAAIDVASRLSGTSADDLMTMYWTARGFPGTWQQQYAKAQLARDTGSASGFALHQMWPNEMFADTFAASNVPSWPDGDQFKVPLDRAKMLAFYSSLPFLMKTPANAFPQGTLHGQWSLVLVSGRATQGAPGMGIGEVWAYSFTAGAAKRIVTYVVPLAATLSDTNLLTRQLSPDGKRLVLAVGAQAAGSWRSALAIVELETGNVRLITSDAGYHDLYPAWSPDGTKIAFARRFNQAVTYDSGLWLVNADGTGLRQLLETLPQGATVVYGWTPDSSGVAYDTVDNSGAYSIYDVAHSTTAAKIEGYVSPPAPGSWRKSQPTLALALSPYPGVPSQLAVGDKVGAPLTVIAGPDTGFRISRPRWNPVSADILYLRSLNEYSELYHVAPGGSKAPTRITTSISPAVASWSMSGTDAVFLAQIDSAVSVRSVKVDGTQEREITLVLSSVQSWLENPLDVLVLAYP